MHFVLQLKYNLRHETHTSKTVGSTIKIFKSSVQNTVLL